MRVFRLCRAHHGKALKIALNGMGAYLAGGRWNLTGFHVAYMSEAASLALLEIMAHADLEDLPEDLVVVSVTVPDDASVLSLEPKDLPGDWREADPSPASLQDIGKDWIMRGDELLLRVPSVIVPDEYHILINARHPHIQRIGDFKIEGFGIDPRLGVGL